MKKYMPALYFSFLLTCGVVLGVKSDVLRTDACPPVNSSLKCQEFDDKELKTANIRGKVCKRYICKQFVFYYD